MNIINDRKALAAAGQLGFELSLPIILGIFAGKWLDARLSTEPKLTLLFLFFGVFLSFYNLARWVKYISASRQKK